VKTNIYFGFSLLAKELEEKEKDFEEKE